jgi:hypothetical protein
MDIMPAGDRVQVACRGEKVVIQEILDSGREERDQAGGERAFRLPKLESSE